MFFSTSCNQPADVLLHWPAYFILSTYNAYHLLSHCFYHTLPIYNLLRTQVILIKCFNYTFAEIS